MSRKRIAAAMLMLVALSLGVTGYIQATRASGEVTFSETPLIAAAGTADALRGFRLNHQATRSEAGAIWNWPVETLAYEEDATDNKISEPVGGGESDETEGSPGEPTNVADDNVMMGDASGAGASKGGSDDSSGGYMRIAGSPGAAGGGGGGGRGNDGAPGSNEGEPNVPDNHPANNPSDTQDGPGTNDPETIVTPPDPPYYPPQQDDEELPPTEPVQVPEPATLALMGLGLAAIGLRRRRR